MVAATPKVWGNWCKSVAAAQPHSVTGHAILNRRCFTLLPLPSEHRCDTTQHSPQQPALTEKMVHTDRDGIRGQREAGKSCARRLNELRVGSGPQSWECSLPIFLFEMIETLKQIKILSKRFWDSASCQWTIATSNVSFRKSRGQLERQIAVSQLSFNNIFILYS